MSTQCYDCVATLKNLGTVDSADALREFESLAVDLHVPDCACYSGTSHCNRNGATASRKEDLLSGGWRFKEERFWRDP